MSSRKREEADAPNEEDVKQKRHRIEADGNVRDQDGSENVKDEKVKDKDEREENKDENKAEGERDKDENEGDNDDEESKPWAKLTSLTDGFDNILISKRQHSIG